MGERMTIGARRLADAPTLVDLLHARAEEAPNAGFRFVKGASDLMSGLTFGVADIAKVRDAAKAKGCKVSGDAFDLCGVTFSLVA